MGPGLEVAGGGGRRRDRFHNIASRLCHDHQSQSSILAFGGNGV